jgi:urea carboxylase-associated protein 2
MNMPHLAGEETPEFYRRRYFELKAQADRGNAHRPAASASENPNVIPGDLTVVEETIPGFWYWTYRITRGHTLRIVNDYATPGVSVFLWNAHDTSERYNAPDSVKVQWTARLGLGKLMLSDMGRVLASITADTCGLHDSIAGGSTPESNLRNYGAAGLRNTRDNFLLAAGKHGLGPRDLASCTTFFAPVSVDSEGRFVWQDGALKQGDYVDLRAEMDLIVALSNCPHPLSPERAPVARPIRAVVWRSPPAGENDLCRHASEEAERAFQNTGAMERGS